MRQSFVLCVSFLLLFLCGLSSAQLLVRKTVTNTEILSSRSIVVKLDIFNPGKSSVHDVRLVDEDWLENFDLKVGLISASWDKIAPGGNVSHTFVVQPKEGVADAHVKTYPALVQYREGPKAPLRLSVSTGLGALPVMSSTGGDIRSGTRWADWGIFSFLSFTSILLPFGFWSYIQLNYEDGLKRKESTKKGK